MKQGLVTIVIPVYDVAKYIDRCLSSVLKQSYKDIEIILVDDGSDDESAKKCDAWGKMDSRIQIIHQRNIGVGLTRNIGLALCNGEYICFFDSDDYVHEDTIHKCYEVARLHNADVVNFGFYCISVKGEYRKTVCAEKNEIYRNKDIVDKFLPELVGPNPINGEWSGKYFTFWSNLFSVRCILENNWKCVSEREIIAEDYYSLLDLYYYSDCIVVLNEIFYYYCQNENSLTNSFRNDKFDMYKTLYIECMRLCEIHKYPESIKNRIPGVIIGKIITLVTQILDLDISISEKMKMIKSVVYDEWLQGLLNLTKHYYLGKRVRVISFLWRKKLILLSCLFLK